MVNILLRKFDTSSKKKQMKITKTQIFWWKTKKCQGSICTYKVAFFTVNSPQWPVMQHARNMLSGISSQSNFKKMRKSYSKKMRWWRGCAYLIVKFRDATPIWVEQIQPVSRKFLTKITNQKSSTVISILAWTIKFTILLRHFSKLKIDRYDEKIVKFYIK